RVIDSLKFPEMDARRDGIVEAHEDTLHWIFEATTAPTLQVQQGDSEAHQDSIYWIRGKPGSGKSTFAKFLRTHSKTQDRLYDWADSYGKEVLITDHFFWIAGTPLQKSYLGMLRHLLYEVLADNPSLVPYVCPRQQKRGPTAWSVVELRQLVKAALQNCDKYVCILVDGMDECETEGQDTASQHRSMLRDLKDLAALPNVKMILTSRPWSAFEAALGGRPNVTTMDQINRYDIVNYVKAELLEASTGQLPTDLDWSSFYDDLELIDKADGVFLWTVLIARKICDWLRSRDSVERLRERLEAIPSDLEGYMRQMVFERISSTFRD
ncbi:hypothetical protein BAUCODRAFT_59267, partial [Baudoinia panamericana UAMH 10762]